MESDADSPYLRVETAKNAVISQLGPNQTAPEVGIVLGSGLSPLSEQLKDSCTIAYDDIPFMPPVAVSGHAGKLIVGQLGGARVACLSGRAHLYEGHSEEEVTFGVRLLAALGVSAVVLSNAAGGIAEHCSPGTLMLITDHLNLTGRNPLRGTNESRWGPRFMDMTEAYDKRARDDALQTARSLGINLVEGVYAGLLGPTYETPAEIGMLERLGASAVGMSTVLETIALRHRGVDVLGISCITNWAAGKSHAHLSHDEVQQVAQQASSRFVELAIRLVESLKTRTKQ